MSAIYSTIYHVRRARPSDRARILALESQALTDADIDDAALIEAMLEEPVLDLDRLIAAGHYFVAEADGEIVAGAGWAPQDTLGDVAFIRSVYVHSVHGESGISSRLVEIAEDAAVTAGYGVILAPVAASVAGTFAALGYRETGGITVRLAAGGQLHRRKMWKHAA